MSGGKGNDVTNWLAALPEDLEYVGEFGPELVLALPVLNWLSITGNLSDRRIVTYTGMRCFYDDLKCREIVEKKAKRQFVYPVARAFWLPAKNEHTFDDKQRKPVHIWPDLRAKFQKLPLTPNVTAAGKPLLIIHNKYCDEWQRGPINFLSIDLLDQIFNRLSKTFTIVYIRHGKSKKEGFAEDHNTLMDFDDHGLTDKYDDVHGFDDLYKKHIELGGTQDINTFKNVLYSRCYHFMSSQGGGAHQIALYSGSVLSVMHRMGKEELWAYDEGYYGFMATIPPIRAICRDEQDMLRSVDLFADSQVVDRRVLVARSAFETVEYLSPSNFNKRRLAPAS